MPQEGREVTILPAPPLVLVAVGVGGRRQLRVEVVVEVLFPLVAVAPVVVVHEGGASDDGEGEGLRVHPGVYEAHAGGPLRRPPPAVRHRRAHRRRPHASCKTMDF